MKKIQQKINNSYDSEPSTSTDDGSCGQNDISHPFSSSTDTKVNLLNLILPNESKLIMPDDNDNAAFTNHHYERFLPDKISSSDNHHIKDQQIAAIIKSNEKSKLSQSSVNGSNDSATMIQFGSGEISNQYNRCQLEMRQVNFDFLVNKHLKDINDFEIVPTSSNENNNHDDDDTIKKQKLLFHDDENSCNAVDINITNDNNSNLINESSLSFNGKINSIGKPNQSFSYINEQSPDMFADYDDDEPPITATICTTTTDNDCSKSESTSFNDDQHDNDDGYSRDKELLMNIKKTLSKSVHSSMTIIQYDVTKILQMYRENLHKKLPLPNDYQINCKFNKQSHGINEIKTIEWPNIMKVHGHGICYNRSTYSENIEAAYMKFAEKNIGAETSSSFTFSSPSSAKKRAMRMKMLSQSPGSTSRLSHLAVRRSIFSSANLSSNSQPASSNSSKLGNSQLVIDLKKNDKRKRYKRKTPKRKTPSKRNTPSKRKTPNRKTPGSERKRMFFKLSQPIAPTRESSKRALFQSPPKEKSKPIYPPEIAQRVDKSKRVLFSPTTTSNEPLLKRKREDESTMGMPSLKIPRTIAHQNSTPKNVILAKSQSFCVGSMTGSSTMHTNTSTAQGKSMFRSNSEQTFTSTQQLSHSHRQKLLWAISESLKKKNICTSHLMFRQYAAVLGKVVKRLFLEFNCNNSSGGGSGGSTSAAMSRISDRVVFWVIQGKSVDDIYLMEKQRIEKSKILNALPKLNGYIAADEYAERKDRIRILSTNESSIDSFSQLSQMSQTSFYTQLSNSSQSCDTIPPPPSATTTTAVNNNPIKLKTCHEESDCENEISQSSSSNNNLLINCNSIGNNSSALRENIDSEQRQKSAQKNLSFSGKNQKNVSPYTDRKSGSKTISTSSSKQHHLFDNNNKNFAGHVGNKTNLMKARRQILFDV